jgi:N-acetylglutamate synthase-like GNAT family acetyltransferase/DNA-binding MarR family transcriptional regulator
MYLIYVTRYIINYIMSFFDQTGKMALGSRLRMLSEQITEDAKQIYKLYDVDLHPKWFPVFYVLSSGERKTVTAIAEEIGHSHPSVSKIVREMSKNGIVLESSDKTDGRKNVISLSKKGIELSKKIKYQYEDVNSAIEEIFFQTKNDLWKAIEEWEFLLNEKKLYRRVLEHRKKRESKNIVVNDFRPEHKNAFRRLNEEWISTYFKMEEADYKALKNPKDYILDKGGHISVALHESKVVGVCALIKMKDPEYDYELAKMAVSPTMQGKSIGWILGKAVIDKAKSMGARKIYLESNTMLKPAINLYKKLGFTKIRGHYTPYERCNIQMELLL